MRGHPASIGNSHLASAKMRSPAGLGRDNDPPYWAAKLSLVASRPGPWRGFGLLSPPAPGVSIDGPGQLPNNEEARDQFQVSLPRPASRAGRRFEGAASVGAAGHARRQPSQIWRSWVSELPQQRGADDRAGMALLKEHGAAIRSRLHEAVPFQLHGHGLAVPHADR